LVLHALDFQGLVYPDRIVPRNRGFTHDIGRGLVTRFRIRARPRATSLNSELEIERNFPAADGAGLLPELLRIERPAASRGSALDVYGPEMGPHDGGERSEFAARPVWRSKDARRRRLFVGLLAATCPRWSRPIPSWPFIAMLACRPISTC
jgi:hypothetical protein